MEYTPLDLFSLIFYKYMGLLSRICGYDIFSPNFKINWHTRSFLMSMFLALVSSAYTMCFYKTTDMLNAAPTAILCLQGILKYFTYLEHIEGNRSIVRSLHDIYVATMDCKMSSYAIMLRWSNLILSTTKIFSLVIISTLWVVLLYPFFVLILKGQYVPMLPMFVPGIDETTTFGFGLMSGLHAVWAAQGAAGLMLADMFYSLLLLHIWPMVDVFGNMLQNMNDAVLSRPNLASSLEIRIWMRNIVMAHQEICLFIARMSAMWSRVMMIDIYTNGLAICIILFSLSLQVWFPLYFLLAMFLGKLFVLCLLGTVVEMATDRILNVIENSYWYLLPVPLQRMILLMIVRAQHPTVMMAGTDPLNMVLFANVMNKVYKFVMVLGEMNISID